MSDNTLAPEEKKNNKKFLGLLLILLLAFGGVFAAVNLGSKTSTKTDLTGTVALTADELVNTVTKNHLVGYWVGPIADATYTLTVNKGNVIVKYIPTGASVKSNSVRQVATYPFKNASATIASNGTLDGNVGFTNIDGNSVFYDKERATNVWIGVKGKDYQIEVYDPSVDQALALVMLKGQVRLIS